MSSDARICPHCGARNYFVADAFCSECRNSLDDEIHEGGATSLKPGERPVHPRDILAPDAYRNYRNIRFVSVLYVILGCLFLLVSIFPPDRADIRNEHLFFAIGITVGGSGVIGGFATLNGNRRWAPLLYIIAGIYLLAIPIGTIMGLVVFHGLSRYFESVTQLEFHRFRQHDA